MGIHFCLQVWLPALICQSLELPSEHYIMYVLQWLIVMQDMHRGSEGRALSIP